MYSILTKRIPATSTKGTRIKASMLGWGSIIIPWCDALEYDENMDRACLALAKKLDLFCGMKMTRGEVKLGERIYTACGDFNFVEVPKN